MAINFYTSSDLYQGEVSNVLHRVGVNETIKSISQPSHSPEKNSQNFIVEFESGKILVLRRCNQFQGSERYADIKKLLDNLRNDKVHAPKMIQLNNVSYLELNSTEEKVAWVFFKYIKLKGLYSSNELEKAAEEVGKLHGSLKKHYSSTRFAIQANAHQLDARPGPALTEEKWEQYLSQIKAKDEIDQYDQLFLDNQVLIETAIRQVNEEFDCLSDHHDIQNIHFDLNATNFLIDIKDRIRIMDYDNVQLGNVYTDIGFALHRLLVPCMKSKERDVVELIQIFMDAYKRGNPDFILDPKKLATAMINRALRNIRSSLDLKYQSGDTQWLSSIAINIERLNQVCEIAKVIQESAAE